MRVSKRTKNYEITLECPACSNRDFRKTVTGLQCMKCEGAIALPKWSSGDLLVETNNFEDWYKSSMDAYNQASKEEEENQKKLDEALARSEPGILERANVNRAKRLKEQASNRAELAVAIQTVMQLNEKGKIEMDLPEGEGLIGFTWGGYTEENVLDSFFIKNE